MKSKGIYHFAADVIEGACEKRGSLKQLCYSSGCKQKKKLFALVHQTLKHKQLLEKLCTHTNEIWKKTAASHALKLVLLYESVLGQGVPYQNEHGQLLEKHHGIILDGFQEMSFQFPHIVERIQKKKLVLPRYVRVNTLKISMEDAIQHFQREDFEVVESKNVNELTCSEFMVDKNVPTLLVFSSGMDFHDHCLYKQGKIILQDKASCLPAFILNPPPDSIVMDACAAPGNKTSHVASIIANKGHIYSFDMDKGRFETMNKLLQTIGATCVTTVLRDFMKVRHDQDPYKNVEYIIVDPSCSGSGIVSRMDELLQDENADNSSRLKGLAGFQTAVLSHALSFPKVNKVVYSTCSIHKEENEEVVEKACKRFASSFRLAEILPEWRNRGVGDWEGAQKCVRADPHSDHCNGFFVALFERIDPVVVSVGCEIKSEEKFGLVPNARKKERGRKRTYKVNDCEIVTPDVVCAEPISVPGPFSCTSNPKKKKKKRTGPRVKKPVTA